MLIFDLLPILTNTETIHIQAQKIEYFNMEKLYLLIILILQDHDQNMTCENLYLILALIILN